MFLLWSFRTGPAIILNKTSNRIVIYFIFMINYLSQFPNFQEILKFWGEKIVTNWQIYHKQKWSKLQKVKFHLSHFVFWLKIQKLPEIV